ncbi:hypothetical protein H4R20_006945, partial [Coemansia guatemalensis]
MKELALPLNHERNPASLLHGIEVFPYTTLVMINIDYPGISSPPIVCVEDFTDEEVASHIAINMQACAEQVHLLAPNAHSVVICGRRPYHIGDDNHEKWIKKHVEKHFGLFIRSNTSCLRIAELKVTKSLIYSATM